MLWFPPQSYESLLRAQNPTSGLWVPHMGSECRHRALPPTSELWVQPQSSEFKLRALSSTSELWHLRALSLTSELLVPPQGYDSNLGRLQSSELFLWGHSPACPQPPLNGSQSHIRVTEPIIEALKKLIVIKNGYINHTPSRKENRGILYFQCIKTDYGLKQVKYEDRDV